MFWCTRLPPLAYTKLFLYWAELFVQAKPAIIRRGITSPYLARIVLNVLTEPHVFNSIIFGFCTLGLNTEELASECDLR